MSRFLQRLLNVQEPLFSNGIARLEKITGNTGIDTRLIADIVEKSHGVMRSLKLDTKDTNGKEFYSALMAGAELGEIDDLLTNTDYVIVEKDGKLISLNLIDVIENFHHSMHFDKQVVNHGQRALMGELVDRYLAVASQNENALKEVMSMIGVLSEVKS